MGLFKLDDILSIVHIECFILSYQLVLKFLQKRYGGVECEYQLLIFENILLCILNAVFIVDEECCKFVLFPNLLFLPLIREKWKGKRVVEAMPGGSGRS